MAAPTSLMVLIGCTSPQAGRDARIAPAAAIPASAPRATVWFFMSTDCPICNNYQPEIDRLRERYSPLGVQWVGVYSEVPLGLQEAAEHVRNFKIAYPTIIDTDRAIRNRFGVRCVPEVVVTAGGREAVVDPKAFLYRGRIDDQYPERGLRQPSATEHDLDDALQAITQGRVPVIRTTTPVGCVLEP